MKWSKLRVKTRSNVCEALRDRIDFHVATYRESHDSGLRRGWITVDRRQIASWSCHELDRNGNLLNEPVPVYTLADPEITLALSRDGKYSGSGFMNYLTDYLNIDPQSALRSEIPLIRTLAVVDRRIGKRSLKKYPIKDEPDRIVKALFELRSEAEANYQNA